MPCFSDYIMRVAQIQQEINGHSDAQLTGTVRVRDRAGSLIERGASSEGVGGHLVAQVGEQLAGLAAVLLVEPVVGIEPHDAAAGGVPQRLVAGGARNDDK